MKITRQRRPGLCWLIEHGTDVYTALVVTILLVIVLAQGALVALLGALLLVALVVRS